MAQRRPLGALRVVVLAEDVAVPLSPREELVDVARVLPNEPDRYDLLARNHRAALVRRHWVELAVREDVVEDEELAFDDVDRSAPVATDCGEIWCVRREQVAGGGALAGTLLAAVAVR